MNQVHDLRRALAAEAERLRPPAGLEGRVLSGLFAPTRRTRRAPVGLTYRVSLLALRLIAGVLILGVLLSVVVVGRLIRDGFFQNTDQMSAAAEAQLAELEARPLVTPRLPADSGCSGGTPTLLKPYAAGSVAAKYYSPMYAFGAGPVYALGNGTITVSQSRRASYFTMIIYTDPTVRGLVLVRGRQLDRTMSMFFIGPFAGGPVVGTDVVSGSRFVQHSGLVLAADHPPTDTQAAPGWGIWKFRMGFDHGAGSCAAFQVDTADGTEVIPIAVRPS